MQTYTERRLLKGSVSSSPPQSPASSESNSKTLSPKCQNPNSQMPKSKIPTCLSSSFIFLLLLGFLNLALFSASGVRSPDRRLAGFSCPMDFSVLRKFLSRSPNTKSECQFALQGLHLVQAEYLRRSGRFLPPPETASACWDSYQALFGEFIPNFDIRSACGFETQWISDGCMNITTRSEFEKAVPENSMVDVRRACDQSLENNSPCATCITSLSRIRSLYLTGREVGNVTDCATYPFIYAAGVVNSLEPADDRSAVCLFLLGAASSGSNGGISRGLIWGVVVSCIVALGVLVIGVWFLCRKNRKLRTFLRRKKNFGRIGNSPISQMGSLGHASTTLIRFTFEEIKEATRNFSNDNIIGRGGYGNVYRGILSNGLEVAMKRFKNCTAAGDASFAHEVEVIASVRHVNLVALRGYCVATTRFEGHQRIIICDLMRNGSLHDHLFGPSGKKLSWPIRQKIAIGMARGLAYLHYGAQPAIMHRDIKASNILLDESFEPKVADFGLAKFTQEGMTHWSTRVAGTLGYVAPEYALYGQLTEKSDVYSFGVVLLELLSGKKALSSVGESQSWLVTDWAWSLVREGRVLDVIEDGMDELGPREVLERYVLVAILSSHPEMHARPTMDQVVKILETDYALPSIPERPLPIVACIEDIEKSVGYSAPTEASIRRDLGLSLSEYSIFGSIVTVGAMIGAVTSGRIADLLGRKGAMRMSSVICIAGWVAIYFSKGAVSLDLGRFCSGYGIGVLSYVVPVFIAEIAPKNLRGGLTTVNQLLICSGLSFAYIVGTLVTWRTLAWIGLVPCIMQVVGLSFIPESPRWLAKVGHGREFEDSLRRLRGKDADISDEALEIQDYIKTLQSLPKARIQDLLQRRYSRSVIVGVGLMVFQQFAGINGIVFYASETFVTSGFSSGKVGTIAVGCIQAPITALGAILMDKTGRRPLLLISVSGMLLGCIVSGMSFYFKSHQMLLDWAPILVLTGIMVYIGSFSLGMGGVPWVMMSEIFPINIKGIAGSLVTLVNWFGSWVISFAFKFLMSWSSSGTFFLFGGICALAILFITNVVPETKGRTLEEIQASMNS